MVQTVRPKNQDLKVSEGMEGSSVAGTWIRVSQLSWFLLPVVDLLTLDLTSE